MAQIFCSLSSSQERRLPDREHIDAGGVIARINDADGLAALRRDIHCCNHQVDLALLEKLHAVGRDRRFELQPGAQPLGDIAGEIGLETHDVARRIAETERLVIGLAAHDGHAALLDLVEGLSCRRRRRDEDAGQKTHAGGDQPLQHWRSPSHDEPQQIRRVGAGFKPALAQQTRAGNLRRDRDSCCRGGFQNRPTGMKIVLLMRVTLLRLRMAMTQSALTPLALIGTAHRSSSDRTNSTRYSGVRRFAFGTTTPSDGRRLRAGGVATAWCGAWGRRRTMWRGVLFGKEKGPHEPQSSPLMPCSSAVASSSSPGARSSPNVAIAFTLPPRICGSAVEIWSAMKSMRPAIRSCPASAEPR